ncbi:hypothetical protein [Celeribacter sp.]|uniref:hypothetical protein n=1 Tax=Celeribacter sp. TaxID=1890673 RepID=UPI003A8C8D89
MGAHVFERARHSVEQSVDLVQYFPASLGVVKQVINPTEPTLRQSPPRRSHASCCVAALDGSDAAAPGPTIMSLPSSDG